MKIVGQAIAIGSVMTATIDVTYPAGAVLTCVCDGTAYTATSTTGVYRFSVHKRGTWVVTAVLGAESVAENVLITADGQAEKVELAFVQIYGISRNITSSSPAWTRTDDAVGKTATASIGSVAGSSDFDTCMPWRGIYKTILNNNSMVYIPKFYYRRFREGNIEHIQIADRATSGFAVHPVFAPAGQERSGIYIGAYNTSTDYTSVSGATIQVSQTRAVFREKARSLMTYGQLMDINAWSALQMLILVEYATNDVQSAIGRGFCDIGSEHLLTGTCDNVPNLTGIPAGIDGQTNVVWRGIEGLWGNVSQILDGLNWYNGTYYVCNDPSCYADDTALNYDALSYTGGLGWAMLYATQVGLDGGNNPHIMLPTAAGSGSATTYMCDAVWSESNGAGWRIMEFGGYMTRGSVCGLFCCAANTESKYGVRSTGSRMMVVLPV